MVRIEHLSITDISFGANIFLMVVKCNLWFSGLLIYLFLFSWKNKRKTEVSSLHWSTHQNLATARVRSAQSKEPRASRGCEGNSQFTATDCLLWCALAGNEISSGVGLDLRHTDKNVGNLTTEPVAVLCQSYCSFYFQVCKYPSHDDAVSEGQSPGALESLRQCYFLALVRKGFNKGSKIKSRSLRWLNENETGLCSQVVETN